MLCLMPKYSACYAFLLRISCQSTTLCCAELSNISNKFMFCLLLLLAAVYASLN